MDLANRSCLAIVLAAGEGKRMRSIRPKVLHAVAGRTLLSHVLSVLLEPPAASVAVVAGPDQKAVVAEAWKHGPTAGVFIQAQRRGTAHAVLAARKTLAQGFDDVLIVFGDTPLIRAR